MTHSTDRSQIEQSLQETYPRRPIARWGWFILIVGFLGFILWATWAPLDNGVAVPGTVMISGNRQAVETASSGVVKQLLVKEGDQVKKNQVLIELDPTSVQSQHDSLDIQQKTLQIKIARLQAEQINASNISFPSQIKTDTDTDVMAAIAMQQQLFDHRKSTLSSELQSIEASIQGQQAALSGLKSAVEQKKAQASTMHEQLENIRQLSKGGYVPKNRLLELERQSAQLYSDIAHDSGVIGQTYQQISELRHKYQQRKQEFAQEVADDIAASQLQLQEMGHRIQSTNFELNHYKIKAPSSGIIVGLNIHTVGGVVSSGHRLMEIVPENVPLTIEGQLPVNQIDQVRTGLPVELLFTAFNQSKTPRIEGTVKLVAPDRLTDEKTGMPYYPLQINVDQKQLKRLDGQFLVAGMPVEIFVKTGERSLLNYLFKPFLDRSKTSWGDS